MFSPYYLLSLTKSFLGPESCYLRKQRQISNFLHLFLNVMGHFSVLTSRGLITLQKRVVRIMSRTAFDAHTEPLFKNLRILNLKDIYKLQIGKFMYQCKSGLLPDSFNDMFLVTRQVHSYGTRSSELFYLPQCRTNISKFSISFQGPNFYNSLSPEIRNATSTASFCSKLKAFLLS